MNVLIVDDHEIVRRGLSQILHGAHGLHVAAQVGTGSEAVALYTQSRYDVVIMDIALPDRSGIEVLKDIRAIDSDARVLVLSAHPEEHYAVRALRAGASGYLTKESAAQELVTAVVSIAAGKRYITASLAERLVDLLGEHGRTAPHEQLSDREFEVLRLIASGNTASEIAAMLSLSVKTVSTYRTRMLQKLGLSSNAELTHYAFRHGLVD